MNWNPIELYLLVMSAISLIAAGSVYEWGSKKKKEAEYWKRQCRRVERQNILPSSGSGKACL